MLPSSRNLQPQAQVLRCYKGVVMGTQHMHPLD